jgi:MFS family permease
MALAALNLGYIVLYLTRSTLPVFLGSLLMMSGYLSGMAVFGAYVRDFTPAGKSGQFQGLRIFSQVLIPGVIGPAIGAAVLSGAEQIVNSDGTTSFVPNANIFAAALAVGAVVILCVLAVTAKARSAAK